MLAPVIIQGGMGVAVSSWRLARAVSRTGQLGVVSGTALDAVVSRRLQLGDPDGHVRRAIAAFPNGDIARRVLKKYFVEGGIPAGQSFRGVPMASLEPSRACLELTVVANFVEVWLAKEGHRGEVGVNYLEKVQAPTLPALYGALLAGADYVLMGAGIPRSIPGALDRLASGEPCELPLDVIDRGRDESFALRFDPHEFLGSEPPQLERPRFLAIVSSATLASMLLKKSNGRVDGFVVEGPTAGGHNAPPRGAMQLNDRGEPVYGPRDAADLAAFRELGVPFWLAGGWGTPDGLHRALDEGAAGVQVGTAFALCNESGLRPELRRQALDKVRRGDAEIVTDPQASPTGFPFKLLQLEGSLTDPQVYSQRERRCDLGYLRRAYRRDDGTLGWRCAAEDVDAFVRKGGAADECTGRQCLCNALLANVGLAQRTGDDAVEPPLVTCGDAITGLAPLLADGRTEYAAEDVVDYLLAGVERPAAATATARREAAKPRQPETTGSV